MTDSFLVSIIVPLFNNKVQISNCLESILIQSYLNFEVILIDDGSTDGSKQIVDAYAKKSSKIKYYYQENKGVSNARNKGLKLCNGDFVLFVDADDYIDSNYIKNFLDSYKEGDDIVFCGLTKVLEGVAKVEVHIPKIGSFPKSEVLNDFMLFQREEGFYGFVCSKMIKTEILKNNNIWFNEDVKLGEDLDFFISYYSYCQRFRFIEGVGYYYIQNSSLNSKKNVDYLQLIVIQNKLEKMLQDANCLNRKNKAVIEVVKSDLKYAYFNEIQHITDEVVEKGINKLQEIKLLKNNRLSNQIIKQLLELRLTLFLRLYLKIRLLYTNFKQKNER